MKEKQTLKIGKYRLNLNTLVFLLGTLLTFPGSM